MIDALEAIIGLLRQEGTDLYALTEGRVAGRHKFGDGWEIPCQALQVQYDGADQVELYLQVQRPRLELRCYGASPAEAAAVYHAVVAVTRGVNREMVDTRHGTALIYWLLMDSGPTMMRDPDADVDMILSYARAAVAERDV
jgi:hypothetical protein